MDVQPVVTVEHVVASKLSETVSICDHVDVEEEPVVTVRAVNIYKQNLKALDSNCWLDCRVSDQQLICGDYENVRTDSERIHAACCVRV